MTEHPATYTRPLLMDARSLQPGDRILVASPADFAPDPTDEGHEIERIDSSWPRGAARFHFVDDTLPHEVLLDAYTSFSTALWRRIFRRPGRIRDEFWSAPVWAKLRLPTPEAKGGPPPIPPYRPEYDFGLRSWRSGHQATDEDLAAMAHEVDGG